MSRRITLGIAGGSAAGKSTFAGQLAESLSANGVDAEILGLDTYFWRDADHGPAIILSNGERVFDCNSIESVDVERMRGDLLTGKCPVTILEGLTVIADPRIRRLLDISIYIDVDADVRALRRMVRDLAGGRGDTRPEAIARYYLESAKVGHERDVAPSQALANFVLNASWSVDTIGDFTTIILARTKGFEPPTLSSED